MARISEQVLAGLARPAMSQGMFDLGAAIGGVPGQMKQKQKQEQFNEIMKMGQAAMAQRDPTNLSRVAQQLAALGYTKESQQFAQAAQKANVQMEQRERAQQISKIDTNSPQGLINLAAFYRKEGDVENAVKYEQAARQLGAQVAAQTQLSAFQEKVAVAAEKANLVSQAAAARATQDMDELRAINDDIREFQIEQLPLDNPAVIKARLKMAGFTAPQITAMGTLSKEEADALLKGRTGKLEAWQDAEGNIKAVNVNDFGLVYNDQTNTYVKASDLQLVRKAPQAQEIIDNTNREQKQALAKAGVDNFIKMGDKAKGAVRTLDAIDRQLARVEGGIPTGIAANLEVTLRQIGQAIGMPYDPQLVDAQNYMQEVAELVKQEIKAFGSGSSITDADREYTQNMVGGDIRVQAEALIKLLNIRREGMVQSIEDYNTIRKGYSDANLESVLSGFPEYSIPKSKQKEDEEAAAVLPEGFELDQ